LRIVRALVAVIGISLSFVYLGCGNPALVPTISQVLPQMITAGSSGATVQITGKYFSNEAIVLWNGNPLSTTMVDGQHLSATVQGSNLAVPGTAHVQVQDNLTGQHSQAVPLMIASASTSSGTTVAPLAITTTSLASGISGTSYSAGLAATGGTPSYSWSITSGQLPSGLTLATSSGIISGTPTAGGTFSLGVTVIDNSSPQQTATATLTLSITAQHASSLAISSATLPGATAAKAYSGSLSAAGGTAPYTWSVTSGQLPSGLSLSASSGGISGTPTTVGTANFSATVTDSGSPAQTASASTSIAVAAAAPQALAITSSTLPSGTNGVAYSQALQVSGGTPGYAWSITSGSLPSGLGLSNGVISGTPTSSGSFNFTASVTDSGNPAQTKSAGMTLVVAVAGSSLTITTSSLPSATDGVGYSNALQASGGTPNYAWTITSGSLPTGLTLAPTTGMISGMPVTSGTSNFTATVSDNGNPMQTKSAAMTLVVAGSSLTITTSTLPSGTNGTGYSQTLQASGGTPGYTWSVTSGSLPAGMSLVSGALSGTPTSSGTFNFTVSVTDGGSPAQTKSVAMTLVVAPNSLTITTSTLPSGTDGTGYSQTMQASGGVAGYTWSITAGSLPNGLTLAPTTGAISGTPTVSGVFNFTASVTDSGSPAQTQSIAASIVVAAAQAAGSGTTWYIRLDGGTNTQCTGTTNAPYPGSGSAMPCAYNHPYQMLDYNGHWAKFAGGDTIQFADPATNKTPYYMGEQNGGVGTDWNAQIGGICGHPNAGHSAGSSCVLPPPPSGTALNPTRIIGQNAGSCHTSQHTGLVNPTILSGLAGAFAVLDVQGTNYVQLSCIEITQPDNCTNAGIGSGGGCGDMANFISTAGIVLQYGTAQGPRNLTMTDIAADGTAGYGIMGSHLNTLATDVLTGSDIYLIGNGGGGWNSDGGGCNTSCESVGTMNLSYIDVEGNGCLLLKPFDVSQGLLANSFNYCFGQNSGGYGDGFVLIASGDITVNVSHSKFNYNTQDGFDGLHISDDVSTSPSLNISSSWAEGNAGQAIKIGTGAASTAINNVTISNCRILDDPSAFPNNPAGWIPLDAGDTCRAAGNQWAFQMKDGSTLLLENNTILGYGTTMFDLGCAFLNPNCGSNGAKVTEINDLHVGYPDPANAGRYASGWYLETGILATTVTADHNLWWNVRTLCPDYTITGETNYVCSDPLMVSESNVNSLNPNLTSGSPAIGAGVSITGITTDYNGVTRPGAPAIGAIE
jgi:putative Ig domain-containing protein